MTETPDKIARKTKTPEERKAELEAKLQQEQKRLEAAKERKKKIEQRLKNLTEPKINRKQDARMKILYGVAIISMMEKDAELQKKVTAFLDATTKKEADRNILGLNPLVK